tara:strand:+ start:1287 stop:2981 length:1695 start_codon:yes stop_codon:yes gene_type:complete
MSGIAYSYIRFSTKRQALGDSLRRQVESTRAYADKHGLVLDESFRDPGKSAFRGEHAKTGALGRFLASVEKGLIEPGSTLIVESLDRLSRATVYDATGIFKRILDAGIAIVTLEDGIRYTAEDLRAEWTKLIVPMSIMSRGHNESLSKQVRSNANFQRKLIEARSGKKVWLGQCPTWIKLADGEFVLFPDRVKVVQRIFEQCAEGIGVRGITVRLNKDKIPTFAGARNWSRQTVSGFLKNEAVIGTWRAGGRHGGDVGERIENFYPRIVSDELFYSATAAMKQRSVGKQGGPHGKEFTNLFRVIGECRCGASLQYNRSAPSKGGDRLYCSNFLVGACGNKKGWHARKSEKAVIESLSQIDLSKVLQSKDAEIAEIQSRVATLQAKVDDTDRRKARVLKSIEEVDDEDSKRDLNTRLKALNVTLRSLRPQLADAQADVREISAMTALDISERQEMLAELFRRQAELEGEERYRLRVRLHQELQRVLLRLEFSEDDIIAFYRQKPNGGRRSSSHQFDHIGFSLIQQNEPIVLATDEELAALESPGISRPITLVESRRLMRPMRIGK